MILRFFDERNSSHNTIKNHAGIVKIYGSCNGKSLNALLEIANNEKARKSDGEKLILGRYFVAFNEYLSENYNIALPGVMTIFKSIKINIT